jgi:transcriptional regulator with XRE-family HTH domain
MTTQKFEHFGARVRKARQLREIGIGPLSKETGIRSATLFAYEDGRSLPSYGSLVAVAKALDVSIDYLASASDDPRRLSNRAPAAGVFAQRLLTLRAMRLMTQDQFAQEIGTERPKVSAWERGRNPGYWTVLQIGKSLDVSIDWLCGFCDQMRHSCAA